MTLPLRPYQETGCDFLAGNVNALLADEMRLGKCAQSIRACEKVGAEHVTVICPASVCETWRREFRKWSDQKFELEVWSYEMAAKGNAHRWCGGDVLILDEAHYLKTHKSARTKAVFGKKCDGEGGLAAQFDRVWLLTGTPMPNNPSELWPMLRALTPRRIISPRTGKPWTLWQFVNKFCKTVHNPHAPMSPRIVGAKNHDALADILDGFMLRRTLAEVKPEVPPLQVEPLYLEGALPRSVNNDPEIEMVRNALAKGGVEALREVAPHVATLRRLTGLAKVEPMLQWVANRRDSGGGKLVLFAYSTQVINALKAGLGSACAVLDGRTRDRQGAADRFAGDPACTEFIGQIQAAGEGIDLSAADELVFVEADWVPKNNEQPSKRIVNLEHLHPKMVRFATLAGSIDEDIQAAVQRKTADILKIVG